MSGSDETVQKRAATICGSTAGTFCKMLEIRRETRTEGGSIGMEECLLEVKELKKTYPLHGSGGRFFGKKEQMYAVDGITFEIKKGETYGLVGESGCGKSTTGRAIVGLDKPDAGSIFYQGKDLCKLSEKEFRPLRKELQMVFQNTLSALNPRQRIGSILEEILIVHGEKNASARKERALKVLQQVGLSEEHYFRYPHELSGGQVQRLGIAGALLIEPKLIVCDEPVSALDVSIQAQILNMLVEIQKTSGISLLFISHDIGVIRFISDRIGVMYLGTLVEEADAESLFGKSSASVYQSIACFRTGSICCAREKKYSAGGSSQFAQVK